MSLYATSHDRSVSFIGRALPSELYTFKLAQWIKLFKCNPLNTLVGIGFVLNRASLLTKRKQAVLFNLSRFRWNVSKSEIFVTTICRENKTKTFFHLPHLDLVRWKFNYLCMKYFSYTRKIIFILIYSVQHSNGNI
jgi:hypothetical protein